MSDTDNKLLLEIGTSLGGLHQKVDEMKLTLDRVVPMVESHEGTIGKNKWWIKLVGPVFTACVAIGGAVAGFLGFKHGQS